MNNLRIRFRSKAGSDWELVIENWSLAIENHSPNRSFTNNKFSIFNSQLL
jgi:hypothetical protein